MASFNDLDGLALTRIAQNLPLASVVSLAATCRNCRAVLGDEENVSFWKRVASEVWGVVGVDAPGAIPRIPGGAGAGVPAESWKETCVAHSRLLSRYGRDAGTRAARAWHRIEAALVNVARAPEILATLAPGVEMPEHGSADWPVYLPPKIHPEVLAAAALHDGQEEWSDAVGGVDGGHQRGAGACRRAAQRALFGTAVVYGDGFGK